MKGPIPNPAGTELQPGEQRSLFEGWISGDRMHKLLQVLTTKRRPRGHATGDAGEDAEQPTRAMLLASHQQAIEMRQELARQQEALERSQVRLDIMQQLARSMHAAPHLQALIQQATVGLQSFPGIQQIEIRAVAAIDGMATTGAGEAEPGVLCFPLRTARHRFGELRVRSSDHAGFAAEDYLLLGSLAHQIALAMERLHLMEGMEITVRQRTAALHAEVIERRNSEEQLRVSEQRYRSLFEHNLAGVVQAAANGTILSCNPAFARMLGHREQSELLGADISNWWGDVAERRALLRRLLIEGPVESYETKLRRRDGSEITVLVSAVLSEGPNRERLVQVTLIDLTQYKQLEEQFRHAQKMEALGRLAGGVAHDFNNLLTVIQGYGDFLKAHLQDQPQLLKWTRGITVASERAAGLTRQLLAFSRLQVLSQKVFSPNQAIAATASLLRRLIGEDIELVLDLHPEVGWIKADPSQFDQVLFNLAVNARDAMPTGGRLKIATLPATRDMVRIEVSDSGCGIDPAIRERIFEPFFSTKGDRGTGLGLSTVHGIIVQSGGAIETESEKGRGTTFRIYLPLCREAPEATTEGEAPANATSISANVLLAEDDGDVRKMVEETLTSQGHEVAVAGNARQALEICRGGHAVEVLVSDVVMPDMDGPSLAAAIRHMRPQAKVLFISGYPNRDQAAMDLMGGAFLSKPFTPQALANAVRKLLES